MRIGNGAVAGFLRRGVFAETWRQAKEQPPLRREAPKKTLDIQPI
jgi:hypothetical protein